MLGLNAAIRGKGSMREAGPQTGGFEVNGNHPLAVGLECLMYAPAGYVDLTRQRQLTTTRGNVRAGERGAFFPYTVSTSVTLSPSVTHVSGEWTVAGLTDFNTSMQSFATFAKASGSSFHTLENGGGGKLAVFQSGATPFSNGSMNNTGWHTHCITGSTGVDYSTGYLDGAREALCNQSITATEVYNLMGDGVQSRAWPDCVWAGVWSRKLSLEEQIIVTTHESGIMWDLVRQEPAKTYFFPPLTPGAVGANLTGEISMTVSLTTGSPVARFININM